MRRLILILLVLFVAATASAKTLREPFDRSFHVTPGSKFTLSNVNGRVNVHAWDQPRIEVRAVKSVESRDDGVARDTMRALRIEVQQTAAGVTIRTIQPNRHGDFGIWDFLVGATANSGVSYEVSVPARMDVTLETVNGAVRLSGVTGSLSVETTNGGVEIVRCAGSLRASTTNGAIRAELAQIAPGRPIDLETTNGRIVLGIPASAAADIDASTTNGRIESDLPVVARTSGRNSLRGTLNGGGSKIRLTTTNGGIDIHAIGTPARASR